jgi:hypothetical protein
MELAPGSPRILRGNRLPARDRCQLAAPDDDEQDAEHRFLVAQGVQRLVLPETGLVAHRAPRCRAPRSGVQPAPASAACRRGRRPPRRPRPHRLARRNRTPGHSRHRGCPRRGRRPRRRARGTAAAPHRLSGRAPRAACRSPHRTRPDSPSQSLRLKPGTAGPARGASSRGPLPRSSLASRLVRLKHDPQERSHPMKGGVSATPPVTAAPDGGCRIKPSWKSRGTLAEGHASAARRDDLATHDVRATDEMAVFGTHP